MGSCSNLLPVNWWAGPALEGGCSSNRASPHQPRGSAPPLPACLPVCLPACLPARLQFFITADRPNVAGLVLAGSADFKTELSQSDLFDPRLQAVVLAVVDVSYGEWREGREGTGVGEGLVLEPGGRICVHLGALPISCRRRPLGGVSPHMAEDQMAVTLHQPPAGLARWRAAPHTGLRRHSRCAVTLPGGWHTPTLPHTIPPILLHPPCTTCAALHHLSQWCHLGFPYHTT
jgi:hypothetical protein